MIKYKIKATEKYTKNGEEKTNYTDVGIVIERNDGSLAIKMNAIPIGNWDGWLNCYPYEKPETQEEADGEMAETERQKHSNDNDLPF